MTNVGMLKADLKGLQQLVDKLEGLRKEWMKATVEVCIGESVDAELQDLIFRLDVMKADVVAAIAASPEEPDTEI